MKVLFITAVFKNEANGAARFAKLVYQKGGDAFTIMSEDAVNGDRLISIDRRPTMLESKMWQYFRVKCYREKLNALEQDFDVFVFNNSVLAYKFKTQKPVYICVHDEKFMKVKFSWRFDYIRNLFLRRIEKSVLESDVHVISNSKYISKSLEDAYSIDPKKISLMYQGIALENKEKPYSKSIDPSRINLIFVKSDYRRGGLIELLEGLRLLDNHTFKLSVVGPEHIKLSDLNIGSNIKVEFKGVIRNDNVVELLYGHDILCIPAREEPLGVAVMEGLAVGIPVVTTGVGGLPEVTENGKHVWENKPNDARSIADQIQACIHDADLRKEKSEEGRAFVFQNFNFEKVVSRLLEIIKVN